MNQLFLMHWILIRYSGLKLKLIRKGSPQLEKKGWLVILEVLGWTSINEKKGFPSFEGWLLLSSSSCHFPLDILFYLFWLQHSRGVHWAQPEILNLLSNKVCLTRRYKWKDEEPPVLNKAQIIKLMHYIGKVVNWGKTSWTSLTLTIFVI